MNIINGFSMLSLAAKVVRGVAAGASEFAGLLAEAGSGSTTSGTGGSSGGAVASATDASENSGSSLEDFLAYMKLSPGEKLRYGVMQEMNLSQAQLDAMSPTERDKAESEIARRLRDKVELQAAAGSQSGLSATATPVALMQAYGSERRQSSLDVFG